MLMLEDLGVVSRHDGAGGSMASAAVQPSAAAEVPWQALEPSLAQQQERHGGSRRPVFEDLLHSGQQPAVRQADPASAATDSSPGQWGPSQAVQAAGAAPAQQLQHPSAAAPSTGHIVPAPAAGAGGLQGSMAAHASSPGPQGGLDSEPEAFAGLNNHPGALGQGGAAGRSEAPTDSPQHPATMVCSPAQPQGQVLCPPRRGTGHCLSQWVEAGSSPTDADMSWQSDHLQPCGQIAQLSPGSPQPAQERAGANAGHSARLRADQPAWDQQHDASAVYQASQQQGQPAKRLAGAGAAPQHSGDADWQPGQQLQAPRSSAHHSGEAAWEQRPRPCTAAQQNGKVEWQPGPQQQGPGTAAQKDGQAEWEARRAAVEQEVAAWRQAAELQAAWELEVWRKEEEVGLMTTGCGFLCT